MSTYYPLHFSREYSILGLLSFTSVAYLFVSQTCFPLLCSSLLAEMTPVNLCKFEIFSKDVQRKLQVTVIAGAKMQAEAFPKALGF